MIAPSWLKTDVSRETLERLSHYVALIEKWNPRINLVSKSSLLDLWDRHIWDSAQIADISNFPEKWADFGSGGGMPGLIMAILAKGMGSDTKFTFVESDQRKCAFLRTVSRELELNTRVSAERIEKHEPIRADVISARALSELSNLLAFYERHKSPTGHAIFPKGETWKEEIEVAKLHWNFDFEEHRSKTNAKAVILKIKDVARV